MKMKKLVLAEKPSVARDIARVLGCKKQTKNYIEGDKYVVTWGLGHLVTLADPEGYDKKLKTWRMEDLPMMPEHLKLVVIPQTRGQFQAVKNQLERKDISEVIIATDAGREGELVARWILVKAGCKKPLKRLWISSVTDKAIREGFAHLKDAKEYDNLYRAAVARAEADWLVGINATRALTCKYNAQLSCGRVQTPTLAMIAAREEEIRHFVPKPYYGLQAGWKSVTFTWKEKGSRSSSVFSKESRDRAYDRARNAEGKVISVKKTKKTSHLDGLYDLTTLQRDANQRFGFSAKQTLNLMQSLYEHHKILTYPRTDSRYLTTDVAETLKERVSAVAVGPYRTYANSILKGKIKTGPSFVNNKKVSDHHAIIPTEQPVILAQLSVDERKIFDLVVRRFLAMLYPSYEYEQTAVTVDCGGETFEVKGNVPLRPGYKEVLTDQDGDTERVLPAWTEGEKLGSPALHRTEGKTKPPARFTEGTLPQAMENPVKYMQSKDKTAAKTLQETGGLGTVATRADIIDKLFRSFLIEKKENEIHMTGKAKQLLQLVPEDLKKPELTAQWEMKLSNIAAGKLRQNAFMKEIRTYATGLTEEIKGGEGTFRHDNLTNKHCPQCGKRLLAVNGKQGKLLVCQDRECGYRERVSRLTNARCPVCHKRMELIGQKDNQKFVCVCGHKESMKAFEERRKREGAGVSKKDVQNYMKKMKKEEKQPVNNALADALANIKLCLLLAFGVLALMTVRTDAVAAETAVSGNSAVVSAAAQKINADGEQIARMFPTDMDVRPVVAHSIKYDMVNVYSDAALSRQTGQVDGGTLRLTAYRVDGNSIYGDYVSGDTQGSGWFPVDIFVEDPDYEPVYATTRDAMYAYTDSSFDEVRGNIKKYTGIIVVSREGGSRQVIYETKDGYEIGWMTSDAFSNCLLYDGREKQILADGTYVLWCGYADDADGGAALNSQSGLVSYDSYTMELIYVSDNNYYIMNQETGQYLSAERASSGGEETAENVKKTSSESKTEEDGTENETAAAWTPVWTAEPDETYGLFHFNRNTGSFAIQNTACRLFLAQNENRELVFVTNRQSDASHWRVSAAEKMLDKAQPMIFTQYDPQWCGTPYGGGGSMGTAGCGVLAAVNAVYSLSGQYMDVMELADYAVEKNYRIVGSGTDDGIFKAACQKFGRKYNFAWDGKSGSIDVLKEKLQAGDVAIVHVQGHYVVIGAYSKKKDKYLLLDSNYLPKRATSAFGDWISVDRLLSGSLEVQSFYFYKLRDTAGNTGTQAQ